VSDKNKLPYMILSNRIISEDLAAPRSLSF